MVYQYVYIKDRKYYLERQFYVFPPPKKIQNQIVFHVSGNDRAFQ